MMERQETAESGEEVTRWLAGWRSGDPPRRERAMELLYGKLRRLVGHYRQRRDGSSTLQTTELIHELYLRLEGQRRHEWQSRSHFFAVAGRLLRRVVVDAARQRLRLKRGGGQGNEPLDEALGIAAAPLPGVNVLDLDRALTELQGIDRRAAQVVELRYFVGLDHDETSEALGIGRATVARSWRFARAWLRGRLEGPSPSAEVP